MAVPPSPHSLLAGSAKAAAGGRKSAVCSVAPTPLASCAGPRSCWLSIVDGAAPLLGFHIGGVPFSFAGLSPDDTTPMQVQAARATTRQRIESCSSAARARPVLCSFAAPGFLCATCRSFVYVDQIFPNFLIQAPTLFSLSPHLVFKRSLRDPAAPIATQKPFF